MTEIESRLKDALQASVADAMPGFDVVAAVRRRRRQQVIRASAASAAVVATVGTAVALLGVHGGSPPGNRTTGTAVFSAIARIPCGATTAKPIKPLPATFTPVAVVRCYMVARGIPGRGLWRFEVKQRADRRLTAFIAALRRPSVPTPPTVACPLILYLDPSFALVDRHGRILRPVLPVMECGRPFAAAITDLQHLPWVTVSVRKTVQISTRAELQAGCDSQWKDMIHMDSGSLQPSAGSPAFSPLPPRLRICIYQDSSHRFIRGGLISQAAEKKLLLDIQGGRTSTRCLRPHTEYAVLLAVSPAYRGGQTAEVELGGCFRILRPDNRVGTVSPAGMAIIRAAGRAPA